jgi:small subunit ribosomal protein S20
MATTKSARKATRVIARRTAVNKVRRSQLRTAIRSVEEAIVAGDKKKAAEALRAAEPVIMRASQHGVLHKNTASRRVSRLSKQIARIGK